MKYSSVIVSAAAMASSVAAAPLISRDTSLPTYSYDASHPPVVFTDPTCPLVNILEAGEPFSNAYPTAKFLGQVAVTPALDAIFGKQTVEDLDSAADDLCVNAQETTDHGNGVCAYAEDAINAFIVEGALAGTPVGGAVASGSYSCLLNLLCLNPVANKDSSVCVYLLAGQDCIANRLIGVKNEECDASGYTKAPASK